MKLYMFIWDQCVYTAYTIFALAHSSIFAYFQRAQNCTQYERVELSGFGHRELWMNALHVERCTLQAARSTWAGAVHRENLQIVDQFEHWSCILCSSHFSFSFHWTRLYWKRVEPLYRHRTNGIRQNGAKAPKLSVAMFCATTAKGD